MSNSSAVVRVGEARGGRLVDEARGGSASVGVGGPPAEASPRRRPRRSRARRRRGDAPGDRGRPAPDPRRPCAHDPAVPRSSRWAIAHAAMPHSDPIRRPGEVVGLRCGCRPRGATGRPGRRRRSRSPTGARRRPVGPTSNFSEPACDRVAAEAAGEVLAAGERGQHLGRGAAERAVTRDVARERRRDEGRQLVRHPRRRRGSSATPLICGRRDRRGCRPRRGSRSRRRGPRARRGARPARWSRA